MRGEGLMKGMRRPRPVLAAVLVGPFVLLAASCGSKRLPVYPVHGKVLYKGKPTPGALVVFHPVKQEDPNFPRPSGEVQEDGSFSLTTYEANDGAPEGEYIVSITWEDPKTRVEPHKAARSGPKARDKPRLPTRYAKPKGSGLSAKVEKGGKNQPEFKLN
jgi:hypothetical protein